MIYCFRRFSVSLEISNLSGLKWKLWKISLAIEDKNKKFSLSYHKKFENSSFICSWQPTQTCALIKCLNYCRREIGKKINFPKKKRNWVQILIWLWINRFMENSWTKNSKYCWKHNHWELMKRTKNLLMKTLHSWEKAFKNFIRSFHRLRLVLSSKI